MSPVRSRSPAPDSHSLPLRSTGFFHLHHKISNRFTIVDERLMRRACGDVDDVSGFQFLACATFDGPAADFAGARRLRFNEAAARHDGCMAINDEEDVCEILMQLAAAAALAIGEHCVMVRILLERLAG